MSEEIKEVNELIDRGRGMADKGAGIGHAVGQLFKCLKRFAHTRLGLGVARIQRDEYSDDTVLYLIVKQDLSGLNDTCFPKGIENKVIVFGLSSQRCRNI